MGGGGGGGGGGECIVLGYSRARQSFERHIC